MDHQQIQCPFCKHEWQSKSMRSTKQWIKCPECGKTFRNPSFNLFVVGGK